MESCFGVRIWEKVCGVCGDQCTAFEVHQRGGPVRTGVHLSSSWLPLFLFFVCLFVCCFVVVVVVVLVVVVAVVGFFVFVFGVHLFVFFVCCFRV